MDPDNDQNQQGQDQPGTGDANTPTGDNAGQTPAMPEPNAEEPVSSPTQPPDDAPAGQNIGTEEELPPPPPTPAISGETGSGDQGDPQDGSQQPA